MTQRVEQGSNTADADVNHWYDKLLQNPIILPRGIAPVAPGTISVTKTQMSLKYWKINCSSQGKMGALCGTKIYK